MQQNINIKVGDEELKGRYANLMQVSHSREEFCLDFFLVHPPVGQLIARVITSPGHAKRILAALADNIKKYEIGFGKIEEAEEPKGKMEIKWKGKGEGDRGL